MRLLGGGWSISKRRIQLNEGGYVAGFYWKFREGFIDAWFHAPWKTRGSWRVGRNPGGKWFFRRGYWS